MTFMICSNLDPGKLSKYRFQRDGRDNSYFRSNLHFASLELEWKLYSTMSKRRYREFAADEGFCPNPLFLLTRTYVIYCPFNAGSSKRRRNVNDAQMSQDERLISLITKLGGQVCLIRLLNPRTFRVDFIQCRGAGPGISPGILCSSRRNVYT